MRGAVWVWVSHLQEQIKRDPPSVRLGCDLVELGLQCLLQHERVRGEGWAVGWCDAEQRWRRYSWQSVDIRVRDVRMSSKLDLHRQIRTAPKEQIYTHLNTHTHTHRHTHRHAHFTSRLQHMHTQYERCSDGNSVTDQWYARCPRFSCHKG